MSRIILAPVISIFHPALPFYISSFEVTFSTDKAIVTLSDQKSSISGTPALTIRIAPKSRGTLGATTFEITSEWILYSLRNNYLDFDWNVTAQLAQYSVTPSILETMYGYILGLDKCKSSFDILRPKYEQHVLMAQRAEAFPTIDYFFPPVLGDIILDYIISQDIQGTNHFIPRTFDKSKYDFPEATAFS